MTDIDIDFVDRAPALADLQHVVAVQYRNGQRERHISGVYFQDIPIDPLDGMAVWGHEVAADKGYFKIDCLNNLIYLGVRDEAHLIDLLVREPPWDRFLQRAVVSELAHLSQHFAVVEQIKPQSILDVAICLALVRPGKRYLIGRPRDQIDAEIWQKTDKFYFKKSHAVAYAASLIMQLNLMVEQNHACFQLSV